MVCLIAWGLWLRFPKGLQCGASMFSLCLFSLHVVWLYTTVHRRECLTVWLFLFMVNREVYGQRTLRLWVATGNKPNCIWFLWQILPVGWLQLGIWRKISSTIHSLGSWDEGSYPSAFVWWQTHWVSMSFARLEGSGLKKKEARWDVINTAASRNKKFFANTTESSKWHAGRVEFH